MHLNVTCHTYEVDFLCGREPLPVHHAAVPAVEPKDFVTLQIQPTGHRGPSNEVIVVHCRLPPQPLWEQAPTMQLESLTALHADCIIMLARVPFQKPSHLGKIGEASFVLFNGCLDFLVLLKPGPQMVGVRLNFRVHCYQTLQYNKPPQTCFPPHKHVCQTLKSWLQTVLSECQSKSADFSPG